MNFNVFFTLILFNKRVDGSILRYNSGFVTVSPLTVTVKASSFLPDKRDWRARRSTSRMTARYILALSFIALLSIADYLLIETRRAANEAGVPVMLAIGRETTLLERIAGLTQSLVLADDISRPEIRERMSAAIAEAETVRANLVTLSRTDDRGKVAKVFGLGVRIPPVDDIRIKEYLKATREFTTLPRSQTAFESNITAAFRNAAVCERLTNKLDRVASDYRTARTRDVTQLQLLLGWALVTMIAVLIGTSLLVFRPMTRRIQQEVAALEASEAYSRAIIETAKDGIIATDTDGHIDLINPSAARMFGLTIERALGQAANEMLPWPSLAVPCEDAAGAGAQGRRTDGSTFPLDLTRAQARVAGKLLYIGIVRDITERRRLEEEKLRAERLATVGAMSAALVHEIRNPLGSIKLNLQLLSEEVEECRTGSTPPGEALEQLLRPISSELDRIRAVTDNYLQFARLPHAQCDEVSLNDILLKGLAFMKPLLEQLKVRLTLSLDAALPKVFGDVEQLWQVFLNLIRNAVDAMPGGGDLSIGTSHTRNEVEVSVTDSGTGISDEKQALLFKPFFTTKNSGTGLGLALVRQIVQEHAGRISCRSTLGRGTSFFIALPQAVNHSFSHALA